jgi:hypothetical protein
VSLVGKRSLKEELNYLDHEKKLHFHLMGGLMIIQHSIVKIRKNTTTRYSLE